MIEHIPKPPPPHYGGGSYRGRTRPTRHQKIIINALNARGLEVHSIKYDVDEDGDIFTNGMWKVCAYPKEPATVPFYLKYRWFYGKNMSAVLEAIARYEA